MLIDTQKNTATVISDTIRNKFRTIYDTTPLVVFSPGRINIIGEHTDYNDGFVLPAAIDKGIYIAIAKSNNDCIDLFSLQFNERFRNLISSLGPTKLTWPNYISGVVDQLLKRGYKIGGFDLVIDGDLPIGSGLSSSAAVECATVYALNELFDLKLTRVEMAEIAQKAEHEFAGVKCGIMDQFASLFGKKDHVIKLDCRTMEYEYFPINLENMRLVLLNTNIKHSLASSEYNKRREECEKGVEIIRMYHTGVKNLRDVSLEMLEEYVAPLDPLIYKRCRFVVEENIRLVSSGESLTNNDMVGLGQRMFETHLGLSRDYEVSCKELDFLVEQVKDHPDVLGARMMGGGFGGCTINLVKELKIDELIHTLKEKYFKQFGINLTTYIVQTNNGTSVIN